MGRAVADQVAARGDRAIVAGRDQAKSERIAVEIGGDARGVAIDLRNVGSIRAVAEMIGPVDHLVLSAAALTYAPFDELAIEHAQAVFDGKFLGVLPRHLGLRADPPGTCQHHDVLRRRS